MIMKAIYDGIPFENFGVRAICEDPFAGAQKNITSTHIPGRNGDLHIFSGEYQNIDVTYLCIATQNFKAKFAAMKAWLCSLEGYKRLEDPIYPDEYRLAEYISTPVTKTNAKDPNTFEITFSCKPQRFLRTGDIPEKLKTSGIIHNPTFCASNPLVKVTGTGTIQINDQLITITQNPTSITIDCEEMEAMAGDQDANAWVSLPDNRIELKPGDNQIGLNGAQIEITPRWWTL